MKQFIKVTLSANGQKTMVNATQIQHIVSRPAYTVISFASEDVMSVTETLDEIERLIYADELEIEERFKALRSKPHPNQ